MSSGEAFEVADAEGAGFVVLARKGFGEFCELFECLPALPELLLKHRARLSCSHTVVCHAAPPALPNVGYGPGMSLLWPVIRGALTTS